METDQKGDIVYIALTDINGNIILRDERNDSTLQNKLYTGHKYDNVTQLTYAHARYLDTRTHTFTSVDPLYYQLSSAQLYNPQLMNAYSYANNNPVSNTDPTGLFSISSVVSSIKSFVSNAVATVKSAVTSFASNVKSYVTGGNTVPTPTPAQSQSYINAVYNKAAGGNITAPSVNTAASTPYMSSAPSMPLTAAGSGAGVVGGIFNSASNVVGSTPPGMINNLTVNYFTTGNVSIAPQQLTASSFGLTNTDDVNSFNKVNIGTQAAIMSAPAVMSMGASMLGEAAMAPEVVFGINENQISHTFRHVDELGLDRAGVASTITEHLNEVGGSLGVGEARNFIVNYGKRKLLYGAYKISEELINVGKIYEKL